MAPRQEGSRCACLGAQLRKFAEARGACGARCQGWPGHEEREARVGNWRLAAEARVTNIYRAAAVSRNMSHLSLCLQECWPPVFGSCKVVSSRILYIFNNMQNSVD